MIASIMRAARKHTHASVALGAVLAVCTSSALGAIENTRVARSLGALDLGSQEAASQDAGSQGTGSQGTGSQGTGSQETGSQDNGSEENAALRGADLRESLLPRADELVANYDCLACHAPDSALRSNLDSRTAPLLSGVSTRVDPAWIERFLVDPRATRPGTLHPHQLIALPEASRQQVATDLVHLFARQDDVRTIQRVGERSDVDELERGRALFHTVGCFVCHGPEESVDDLFDSMAGVQRRELDDDKAPRDAEPDDDVAGVPVEDDPSIVIRPGVLDPEFTPLPVDLAQKVTRTQLAGYLLDPLAVRPSGHCPSMSLTGSEARAVAAYLLRSQAQRADGSFVVRPGLERRVYEFETGDADEALLGLEESEPVSVGTSANVTIGETPRDDRFGIRLTGWLEVPEDGNYTFYLTSDDGSRLVIDGELVVDNGGSHPALTKSATVELFAGPSGVLVDMVEIEGNEILNLAWEGPGFEKEPVPPDVFSHWPLNLSLRTADGVVAERATFTVDQARADRGARAFLELGCASCHTAFGESLRSSMSFNPELIEPTAPSLELLGGVRPGVLVCMRPGGRYDLPQGDVGELLSAFLSPENLGRDVLESTASIHRSLVRRQCYSCHRRDDIGGVHPTLAGYFVGDETAELGNEGRFPPTLTVVGRKFREGVLEHAIHGEERVRPYLRVRMPKIGAGNLPRLANALASEDLDRTGNGDEVDFCSPQSTEAGRRLAGDRGGLGCVQCHNFRGTASLGVQAVDMDTMHRRLSYGWFRELLLDPSNVDLEGRMANLWIDDASPVTDIADGDIEQQIEALWCWLGEGDSMAPPPGLDGGPWAYELTPDTMRPRLVSVFMEGVSPRVVCVGTNEGVHIAFDVESSRVAKAWRGRFLNVMGTWQGRGGALESPGSNDVVDLPSGLVVMPLPNLVSPWPVVSELGAAQALGRTVGDDGSVTFRYAIGDVTVAETIRPVSVGAPARGEADFEERPGIERTLEVHAPSGGVGMPVVARIAVARQFAQAGRGMWREVDSQWPLYDVDGTSARSARVVTPRAPTRARPTGGDRTSDQRRDAALKGGVFEELRVPITMRPSGRDDGGLIGTLTWRYSW